MTSQYFDQLETRDPEQRELAQFNMLPGLISRAKELAPGWARHLADVDPQVVTSREALAQLPILRKSALKELQAGQPPFGGFATSPVSAMSRIYMSPGPIFEPEGKAQDWWRSARALYAAGFRGEDESSTAVCLTCIVTLLRGFRRAPLDSEHGRRLRAHVTAARSA